ncbi:MAG: flagellar basal body rod protein FlgC [Burkholderiales bacterium]|nr:flagellar basal body rod protein FlgC [Burkholderiales bacterium]
MSLTKVMNIAGTALQAQSQRLNTVASNLANAESVAGPDGQAYRARHVVFQAAAVPGAPGMSGVKVTQVIEDNSPGRKVFDPEHPLADAEGYVTGSNVNAVEEMVNMISAARSYQTSLEVMNTAKNLLAKTLNLGS